jgi:hypothetical protein
VLGHRIRRAARSPLCLLLARKSVSRLLPDLAGAGSCGVSFPYQAANKAGATHASAASDYPPTTSDSTISSLLTLFSKFFSPFLRSTCSLSVSHKYLALEEVYLPFRAAVPNNPTLKSLSLRPATAAYGAFTLFGVMFQGTYAGEPCLRVDSLDYNSGDCVPRISTLSFCLFTRRYWGNPC